MHVKKSEMSQQQLEERETVVERLTRAGWEATAFNRLFDKGKSTRYEASMEYKGRMDLTVTYEASKRVIDVGLYTRSGSGVDLVIQFKDKLRELLDYLISIQDTVDAKNYKDHIRQLLRICPEIYTPDRNDRLVPVLLDQGSAPTEGT